MHLGRKDACFFEGNSMAHFSKCLNIILKQFYKNGQPLNNPFRKSKCMTYENVLIFPSELNSFPFSYQLGAGKAHFYEM